jgi:uncharacterized glyoxalase superfamily protein PhnB
MSQYAPHVTPVLRYRNAARAIEFLVDGFGFSKVMVAAGEDGLIEHAELRLGDGLIMVSSIKPGDIFGGSPRELGGVTGSLYVAVDDVDAHCERAKAAGAEIVMPPADHDFGSPQRGYSARDREGHVWSFGTYRPSLSP